MNNNEKLIEEAAKAVHSEHKNVLNLRDSERVAATALAVFEKAHTPSTPTDDERVARLMARVTPLGYASALALVESETRMIAEANAATCRLEVNDARIQPRTQSEREAWDDGFATALPILESRIDAAAEVFAIANGDGPWDQLTDTLQDDYRRDALAALRAASAVTEQGENRDV